MCLAKLCPYIYMSSFAGFTGKKKNKRAPVCRANLFLALILLLQADHSRLALEEGWSIIFLIKFATELRNGTNLSSYHVLLYMDGNFMD